MDSSSIKRGHPPLHTVYRLYNRLERGGEERRGEKKRAINVELGASFSIFLPRVGLGMLGFH